MFWNDIKEIKADIAKIIYQIGLIESSIVEQGQNKAANTKFLDREEVENCLIDIEDAFCPDDKLYSINRLHDKLNKLLDDERRKREVILATKTLDKFEDYMKNVDKLNGMINEFKGCVSISRGALEERNRISQKEGETARLLDKIAEKLQKCEKKSPKKRKSVKKKVKKKAADLLALSE
jgi:hypothetical protein